MLTAKTGLLLSVLAAPVAAAGVAATASWVIVDVHEKGPDGHRIVVPVPLVLARLGVLFAPPEARQIEAPDMAVPLGQADALLDLLARSGDAEIVRVEQGREQVSVRSVGGELRVDVLDGDEEVHVRLPLELMRAVIAGYDPKLGAAGGFRTSALVASLGAASNTEIVRVSARDADVTVRIW